MLIRRLLLVLALVAAWSVEARAQVTTHGMTITSGPLIWHDSVRLAAAQARYAASPSTYALTSQLTGTVETVRQQALIYQMTGVCSAADGFGTGQEQNINTCGDAIAWLLNTTDCGPGCRNEYLYPTIGGSGPDANDAHTCETADYQERDDYARWFGEITIDAYSWLREAMTAEQRQAVLGCMVRAAAAMATKSWGAPVDHGNNYMWGYTRNLLLTAIVLLAQETTSTFDAVATNCSFIGQAGANSMNVCGDDSDVIADEFLDEALDVRWTANLLEHLNGPAKGGIANEGQNYGHYLWDYVGTQMRLVMEDYGRDLTEETPYWEEAAVGIIYASSNRPMYSTQAGTIAGNVTQPWYAAPTYGDTQGPYGSPFVGEYEEGAYMTLLALKLAGTELGARIRYWLTNTTQLKVIPFIKVLDGSQGAAGTDFSAWPLAYCGTGFGACYVRDSWARTGSPSMFFLLAEQIFNPGGNHPHCADPGTWQAWRGQRWVSKTASAAYSRGMTNLAGTAATNAAQRFFGNGLTVNDSGDNGFCLTGNGFESGETPNAEMTRLQYHEGSAGVSDDFLFAASNLGVHIKPNLTSGAALSTYWRDWVVLPDYSAMCVLDRVVTTSDVNKKSFIHFPATPTQASNVWTGENNGEFLRAVILADALASHTVTYAVVDESAFTSGSACPGADCDPQQRLQINVTGSNTSYIPYCVQTYSTGGNTMSASASEDESNITISLSMTGKSNVSIVFAKGATSTGGQVTIGSTTTAFDTTVATVTADRDGVSWGAGQDPTPSPGAGRIVLRLRHRF